MVAALNGMALHGGLIPYGGTFLVFSDYARGAIRLAALQQAHVVLVFTHDSIGMGEDGPTHQPVEQLLGLRSVPGLTMFRPADANEAVAAWRLAIERSGPSALVFTRQKIPVLDLDRFPVTAGVPRGGYVLSDPPTGRATVVLLATGSEVSLALEAQSKLAERGVPARVVSLPSWRVFDEQPSSYRDEVLPPGVPVVSVEAATTLGWSRYVGTVGASAPGPVVLRELGFTPEHVADVAASVLRSTGSRSGP